MVQNGFRKRRKRKRRSFDGVVDAPYESGTSVSQGSSAGTGAEEYGADDEEYAGADTRYPEVRRDADETDAQDENGEGADSSENADEDGEGAEGGEGGDEAGEGAEDDAEGDGDISDEMRNARELHGSGDAARGAEAGAKAAETAAEAAEVAAEATEVAEAAGAATAAAGAGSTACVPCLGCCGVTIFIVIIIAVAFYVSDQFGGLLIPILNIFS